MVIRTPCWLQLQRLEMSQPCSSALYLTRTADFLVYATGRLDSKKLSPLQPMFERLSQKIAINLVKRSVPSSQSLTSRARLTGVARRRPVSSSRRLRRQMHTHRQGWRDIPLFRWWPARHLAADFSLTATKPIASWHLTMLGL